jgi:hypothetical protein
LLLQGGLYTELWRKQSGGFNPVARQEEVEPAAAGDNDLQEVEKIRSSPAA